MREPGSARKPYRVSKQRCPWSTEEHARFLEAIDRYGRAWPKIVAHIGTRSVQQVRSHAQKYFLKLEKAGNQDAVPPPRPKKRAARPYPTLGTADRRARGERGSRPGHCNADGSGSGGEDSECTDSPASSGGRSPRVQATTRAAARCRTDHERMRSVQSDQPSSPAKVEGDGSNIEHSSDGTCAENSAHSTGDNVFPAGLELGLDAARGSFAVLPAKQDVAGPSGQRTAQGAKAAQADAPASKAALGSNDFGRLYNLVGSLCGAEPEAKQRMLEQLGPSQRDALAAMMGHLSGNLRAASCSGGSSAGASGTSGSCEPTPFAAPEVQAPAAVARTLAACGARPGFALPASLEPFPAGPGLELGLGSGPGSGRGLQLGGRLLDESSSVPELVGLPPQLASQPDAQLMPANPELDPLGTPGFNPSRIIHSASDTNASLVSSKDRGGGGSSACELDAGARFGSVTGGAAAALEADLARSHAMALAQQQCVQVTPGMYADHLRHAAQLAHHQMELAQAQLLPHMLLPGSLPMSVETTQSAPSVPADFLPKWQAECDPGWQADVDPGADLAVPGFFAL